MGLRYFIFISFFSVIASSVYGQRTDLAYGRELKRAVGTAVQTDHISVLHKLNVYYVNRYIITSDKDYLDSALVQAQKADILSSRLGAADLKYESKRLMGNTIIEMGDSVKSQRYIEEVLTYFQNRRQFFKFMKACFSFAEASDRIDYCAISARYYLRALAIEKAHHPLNNELYIKSYYLYEINGAGRAVEWERESVKMVNQYKNSGKNLSFIYNMLATTYRYRGDLKKALEYGIAGLRDVELHNDTITASKCYAELALIYDVLGEYDKSIFNYRKCLEYRLRRPIGEVYIFRTQGFIVKDLIKLKRPMDALNEVIDFKRKHPPQGEIGEGFCDQNLAFCYEALKEYSKAERYYLKMLKSPAIKTGSEVKLLAYYDVVNFYILRKQYKLALQYAIEVQNYLSSLDNFKTYENYRFKIDSALGDYKSALYHYGRSQKAKDSLLNESKIREVSELQLKYESSQKEKDIALLKKDGQIQRDRAIQSDRIRNITLAGIGIVSIALILVYATFLNNRKKSRVIDQKNEKLNFLLDEKDGLLQEKQWLIKEIHHRVKNNLQIVMGLLQRQSFYIDNEIALKAIQNSENRMHAIALIHQKLYMSETLDLINMQEYIDELVMHIKDTADIDANVLFVKDVDLIFLDVSQAVPLGLILNEAITNSIKYAYPDGRDGKIHIEFRELQDYYNMLTIRDDGAGFKENFDIKAVQSMGLNLMRGLAKQLGGTLELSQDNGVVIEIKFKAVEFAATKH
ncbi:MAG: sensor histidine kinase [Mucilaginibacter sp.]|uniref:histidine kinase dimerization/phosphoacceptor domain -containing protein n=1 Tax=Mucilaginibacter sp. TaxID=1882438 RepID=UPI003566EAD6